MLALVLLAAAGGITWWAEEPTAAMVKVTKTDDSIACGPYAGTNDTTQQKDGSNQQGIPLNQIKSIEFRQKC